VQLKQRRLVEPKSVSIRDFYNKRNKILVIRETGGLGDILMHRMIFEDFKQKMPDAHVVFACPKQYHDAVSDHPFIDEVVDNRTVDLNDYIISYNTTSICGRYELAKAPLSGLNRSDIWANYCGVELNNHKMHIKLTPEEDQYGIDLISKIKKGHTGPSVLIAPISAMVVKNLLPWQLKVIVEYLNKRNCFIFGLHSETIMDFTVMDINLICKQSIRQWMSVIKAADYVVSVDTSTFHFAGGIGKPLTGIFTFADGKVYGKYYNFELVQKHRDDKNWACGPCYNWGLCPLTTAVPKPCLTQITGEMLTDGLDRMFKKWPI